MIKKVPNKGVISLKNKVQSLVRQVAEYYTRKGINDLLNDPSKEPTMIIRRRTNKK